MSAETLRKAAELIREDPQPCKCGRLDCPTRFYEAVATLLDAEAALIDGATAYPDLHMPLNTARTDLLTAVASAYLRAYTPPTSLASDTNPPGSEAGEHHVTRQTGSPAG